MTIATEAIETYLPALRDIAQMLFETMLQLPIAESSADQQPASYELAAAVGYAGVGKGGVLLECSSEQAFEWCSRLCSLAPPVEPEDARDGLGELCNMLAGNLKPLFPSGTTLATPVIWSASSEPVAFAKCVPVGTINLSDHRGPFRIRLFLG